jgi:hypothetical protein
VQTLGKVDVGGMWMFFEVLLDRHAVSIADVDLERFVDLRERFGSTHQDHVERVLERWRERSGAVRLEVRLRHWQHVLFVPRRELPGAAILRARALRAIGEIHVGHRAAVRHHGAKRILVIHDVAQRPYAESDGAQQRDRIRVFSAIA